MVSFYLKKVQSWKTSKEGVRLSTLESTDHSKSTQTLTKGVLSNILLIL